MVPDFIPERSVAIAVKKLVNQFNRYVGRIRSELTAKFEPLNEVTEVQGHIIGYLCENIAKGPVYQKDLEKQFNIRRSTATIILKRMEKGGFIVRETCGSDARMKAIILTEKSKQLHPAVVKELVKAEMQARKGLTTEELDQFLRTVDKILQNIK